MMEIDLLSKEISAARSKKTIFNTIDFLGRMLHSTSKLNGEKDFGDYVLENYDKINQEVVRRVGHIFSSKHLKYRKLLLKKNKLILTYTVNNCFVHSFQDAFNGGYESFRRFYSMDNANTVFLEWRDEAVAKVDLDFRSFERTIEHMREQGKEGTVDNIKHVKTGISNLSSLYNATMSQMAEVGRVNKEHGDYILEVIIHKVNDGYETEVILKEPVYFGKKVVLAPKANESEYPITIELIKSEVELNSIGIDKVKRSFYKLPDSEYFSTGELLVGLPVCKLGYKEVYLVKNEPASYSQRKTTYDLVLLG